MVKLATIDLDGEIEVWRDIVGYEGLYQVSDFGRVRSLNYKKTGEVRVLKHGLRYGYPSVSLCKNNKAKSMTIHSIEVIAFLDPDYLKNGLVV